MTESERNLGRRWFEEVWNQQRRETIAELIAPQALLHDAAIEAVGPESFFPFFDRFNAAFSELHIKVEDSIAEGDKISVRWLFTAKHTGDALGVAASGLPVRFTGITIFRVAGGRFVEGWQHWD